MSPTMEKEAWNIKPSKMVKEWISFISSAKVAEHHEEKPRDCPEKDMGKYSLNL